MGGVGWIEICFMEFPRGPLVSRGGSSAAL